MIRLQPAILTSASLEVQSFQSCLESASADGAKVKAATRQTAAIRITILRACVGRGNLSPILPLSEGERRPAQ